MQDQQDIRWMKVALKYAYYAKSKGEIPIGSIIVLKERIIGIGWNSSVTKHDPTAHAEIMALRHAGKTIKNYRLVNSTLYVTLEPCIMCCGAIIHSRIKRLVFGTNCIKDNQEYSLKKIFIHLGSNYTIDIKNNIMKNKCSKILINFFQNKRKKNIIK
ncbi:tRNA adenosine(34) deaminase TadA [Buchnera aphidicola (Macrosiphoniella sanborni)]|uniref:tRNA-specific adenosine deaminase n=1 Tax=Buchnera aphidicola (Macrosiphoniella sanborni) TaxID=1241865 RepID=A0A4D6YEU8_9GAMM|nr:tRNA adenosine(34) deaminase TadA [Buchnera aphidicola]QCI24100.1 tRNA adenosine(34) deaminase TadA [Buchnera aphidicola (Macrosiphoniella sanborni)]